MRFALIFVVALAACGQPAEAPAVAADEMPVFSSSPIGGWVFRDVERARQQQSKLQSSAPR